MSGVIATMRRTLLSCTSLVRDGIAGAGTALLAISAARAQDAGQGLGVVEHGFVTLFDLDRQEIAALTLALAVLGFSVVAAILLMRARLGAARNEARLRSVIQGLQAEADRFRALLFAEPQVLISWAAPAQPPQITAPTS